MARATCVTMLLSLTTVGCLVPPDGRPPQLDLNFPPEIDLSTAEPRGGRIIVNRSNCPTFRIEVGTIRDLNDGDLSFRWVANNDLPFTRDIAIQGSPGEPGEPRPTPRTRVVLAEDFPNELDQTDPLRADSEPLAVGILSLFVTDAPGWALEDEILTGADAVDLSEPAGDGPDGGADDFAVVEVRWAIQVDQLREECPPL